MVQKIEESQDFWGNPVYFVYVDGGCLFFDCPEDCWHYIMSLEVTV